MENQILSGLSEKTKDLLFFSESEAPLLIENLGQLPKDQLDKKLIELNSENPGTLKTLDPDEFFAYLVKRADPGDHYMVDNANKFTAIYAYLKANFSDIAVKRIEGGVHVPIIITAYQPDGSCISLSTYAIET
ncbi:hypothetical protein HDF26_005037 [Pedobacter cryoconitis]|uniref:Nuclease A inhibitor-like protein n=1 Tax=Pedobacter cryoconitis TaxID=188932 RepID=A0A7W9E096_9SPHI|nr:nuclease A inhibitor family protein [Pedobacter cryoconitis]MBB5636385.1 hypothetical protein [Pedobacter cryoconitis]MBB6274559.1 hypothetical protein [Pedobacter cryoconitis]